MKWIKPLGGILSQDPRTKWEESLQTIRKTRDEALPSEQGLDNEESHLKQLVGPAAVVAVISVVILYAMLLLTSIDVTGKNPITRIAGLGVINGDIAELFAGLAGWVAGFAGAYVAIKIASVATSIQTHDSITDFEELMEHDMELISNLNAKIVKSSLTVRRAITANLMWYERDLSRKKAGNIVFNDFDGDDTVIEAQNKDANANANAKVEINKHLLESLECFSSELESAIRNPVYWKLLAGGLTATESDVDDEPSIEEVIKIVEKDEEFYDFVSRYEDNTDNMMSGLNDLRVSSLQETFGSYIRYLLRKHWSEDSGNDKLTISQLSWIILGALVHRTRAENNSQTKNEGVKFLALMFGSLPNDECLKIYFDGKINETKFDKKLKKILRKKMDDLRSRVFFPHGPGSKKNENRFSSGFLNEIIKCLDYLKNNERILLMSVASSGISGNESDAPVSIALIRSHMGSNPTSINDLIKDELNDKK